MLVLVAPGQGAQKPGFLTPWLDLPGVTERLRWWSAVSGLDLVHYGTEADEEAIRDTAVAQPLLVAAGLVSAQALFADGPHRLRDVVGATAGHSVGEITAAAAAGVLGHEAAMVLVRQRGLAMAEAAGRAETGMAAILGGEQETVVAHLDKHGLTPANVNGAGQIVAAGTAEQLAALAEDKPEGVRRVVPLKVAGAFHTDHMAPAVATLENLVAGVPIADPGTAYVSNRRPGVQPGPLGPVHGNVPEAGRHRDDRGGSGRDAHRYRQAGPAGGGDAGPQDSGRPRRATRADRPARRTRRRQPGRKSRIGVPRA